MRKILFCLATVLLSAGSAAEKPERWTDPDKSYSCVLPKNWLFDHQAGPKAVFKEKKTPPAFLNVDAFQAGDLPAGATKDLDAFVKDRLEFLTVKAKDAKACKVSGCEAVRASGTVGASGGALLDLLAFVRGPERWYAVMLTCLPKDRAAYEPVFEAFLKSLEIPKAKEPAAP